MEVTQVKQVIPVTPPDLTEKNLDKLAEYVFNQLENCRSRPWICACRYEYINNLRLGYLNCLTIPDQSSLRRSSRIRDHSDRLSHHRAACQKVYGILYRDDLRRIPYLTWSDDVLVTSLKQRRITLPRQRVRAVYVSKLQHADVTRTFAFMDLPQEIRLMVYEFALQFDEDFYTKKPYGLKPATKPALLQTCSQIREEATPIFYRINRFLLRFGKDDSATSCRTLSWMKRYVSATDLQNLRYITLSSFHYGWSYHIKIDLNCRDPLKWTLQCNHESRHNLSCNNHYPLSEESTVMQERYPRRNCALAKHHQNAGLVAANLAAAHKAIGELWEACGENGRIKPSFAGLLDFVGAVKDINTNLTQR
ncbi:unnamed protein product [Aureobasidium mustum]|uniref:2EXR domain-containing protein n=1 Tax=Aureobasidium mustum TaxID=2773714 RepID=A0A9N8K007_9PEZI|nr:unnamed protein product [Aureobasidium mustum]